MSARDECLPASRRKEVMSVILRGPAGRREGREGLSVEREQGGRLRAPRGGRAAAPGGKGEEGTYSTPQEGLRGP